jgi:hypothetical protein
MNYVVDDNLYLTKKIQIYNSESYIYTLYIKYRNVSMIYYFFFYNALELIKNIKKIKFDIDIQNVKQIIQEYNELIDFKSHNDDKILENEIINTIKILKKYEKIIQDLNKYVIKQDNDIIINIINYLFFIKDTEEYTILYENLKLYNDIINEMVLFNIFCVNKENNFDNIDILYKKVTNKNLLIETYSHMYKLYNKFFNKLKNDINIYEKSCCDKNWNKLLNQYNNIVKKINIIDINIGIIRNIYCNNNDCIDLVKKYNNVKEKKHNIEKSIKQLENIYYESNDIQIRNEYDDILQNMNELDDNIYELENVINSNRKWVDNYTNDFIRLGENNEKRIEQLEKNLVQQNKQFYEYMDKIYENIYKNFSTIEKQVIYDNVKIYLKKFFEKIIKNNIIPNLKADELLKILNTKGGAKKIDTTNDLNYKIGNIVFYNFNKLFGADDKTSITINDKFFTKVFILIAYIYKILLKNDDNIYKQDFFNIVNLFNTNIHNLNLYNIEQHFDKYIDNELKQPYTASLHKFIVKYNFNVFEINQILNTLFDNFDNFKDKFIYINKLYIYDKLIHIYKNLTNLDDITYDYTHLIKINDKCNNYNYINNIYITNITNIYDIINNLKYNLNKKNRSKDILNILNKYYDSVLNYIDENSIDLNKNYFNIEHITYDNYIKYEYYLYLIKNILSIIKHKNNIDSREFFFLKYFKLYYKIKNLLYKHNIVNYDVFSFNKKIFYNIIKLKIIKQIAFGNNNKNSFDILLRIFNKYY